MYDTMSIEQIVEDLTLAIHFFAKEEITKEYSYQLAQRYSQSIDWKDGYVQHMGINCIARIILLQQGYSIRIK